VEYFLFYIFSNDSISSTYNSMSRTSISSTSLRVNGREGAFEVNNANFLAWLQNISKTNSILTGYYVAITHQSPCTE